MRKKSTANSPSARTRKKVRRWVSTPRRAGPTRAPARLNCHDQNGSSAMITITSHTRPTANGCRSSMSLDQHAHAVGWRARVWSWA
jgi:hypothetical protein